MNSSPYDPAKNLTSRDYYQLAVSILMTILGPIILVRTLFSGVFVLPILVGAGLIFLGIYRLIFIYRFLKGRTN
jgi:uncharacterized membrane protein HdeD (DUF308 family)